MLGMGQYRDGAARNFCKVRHTMTDPMGGGYRMEQLGAWHMTRGPVLGLRSWQSRTIPKRSSSRKKYNRLGMKYRVYSQLLSPLWFHSIAVAVLNSKLAFKDSLKGHQR